MLFVWMSTFISVSRTNQSKYWELISWGKERKKIGIYDQTENVQIEPIWNRMSSTNKTTLWLELVASAKRDKNGVSERMAHARLQIKTIIDCDIHERGKVWHNLIYWNFKKMRAYTTRMIHISIPFG